MKLAKYVGIGAVGIMVGIPAIYGLVGILGTGAQRARTGVHLLPYYSTEHCEHYAQRAYGFGAFNLVSTCENFWSKGTSIVEVRKGFASLMDKNIALDFNRDGMPDVNIGQYNYCLLPQFCDTTINVDVASPMDQARKVMEYKTADGRLPPDKFQHELNPRHQRFQSMPREYSVAAKRLATDLSEPALNRLGQEMRKIKPLPSPEQQLEEIVKHYPDLYGQSFRDLFMKSAEVAEAFSPKD